jgi:hypothetical protein
MILEIIIISIFSVIVSKIFLDSIWSKKHEEQ